METTDTSSPSTCQTAGAEAGGELGSPDRRIDAAIHRTYRSFTLELRSGPVADGLPVPCYTRSLDAVIDLAHELLPGWDFGVSTDPLADHVWLMPGQAQPEQIPSEAAQDCQEGTACPGLSASFPQSPRAAMSLLAVLVEVKAAMDDRRTPDKDTPAARKLFSDATTTPARPLIASLVAAG